MKCSNPTSHLGRHAQKGATPWNMGLTKENNKTIAKMAKKLSNDRKGIRPKWLKGFEKGSVPWNKGIKSWVKPWLGKKRPDMNGSRNPAWKGDDAGYMAIHDWNRKTWGKINKCEFCGKEGNSHQIHWANKDHKYKRDRSDWLRLCVSCHYKYDDKRRRI